jgi:hypothetical protein
MPDHLKVLITVKTHPIPSAKYDELVCTAGVIETGDFIRLYPINFRDLPWTKQYRKYQWPEVEAVKHTGWDSRKESYRPDCATIRLRGEPVSSSNNWDERAKYVLAKASQSMEELYAKQEENKTSLGISNPRKLLVSSSAPMRQTGILGLRQL